MNYNPLVSIVIPTYNRETLIPLTLETVFAQSYTNYEILIIDDGSDDNTKSVVKSLHCPQIKFHEIAHQGACGARNTGIRLSKGEITCFLDSDDLVEKNFLKNAVQALENPSTYFVSSNCSMTREFVVNGETVSMKTVDIPEIAEALEIVFWKKKVPLGTGLFFRTEAFQNKVQWDNRFKIMEELDFFIQLFRLHPDGFQYLPQKGFTYRQRHNSDGTCSNVSYAEIARTYFLLHEKHKDFPAFADMIIEYKTKHNEYLDLAEQERAGKIAPHMFRHFPELYTAPHQPTVSHS